MKKLVYCFFLFALNSYAQISEQWAFRYSGLGDYSAKYTCVAKDITGNFYLGGYTVSIDNNRDYLIVKLNSAGDTLWTRTYRGTDNSADEVNAIAVDKNSNVYVTGFANGNGTGNDILTIKLNTNGDTLWKRFYNYTANDDDNGNSLALDTAGNVFVTGESDANPSGIDNFDYITLKYDAAGNQMWANRYGATGTDKAVKVVTDISGNCYVTGRTYANGLDDNFATIKYSASGVQQWLKTYDGGANDRAVAMAIDSSSSFIYVTGRSDNGFDDDIVTLKYGQSAGTLTWTKVYNNVDDDRPVAITVDAAGFVYVTGQSDADASINRNWNFITVKYAANSVLQWSKVYTSSITIPYEDVPSDIRVNSAGDVFVTGMCDFDPSALNQNFNFTTLKYTNAGTLQWTKTFAGNANSTGGAKALIVDNNGLPLVVGSAENLLTKKDALAIKYDALGNEIWNKSYLGNGDNSDNAYKIKVDASENSYIVGYSINEETDRNMLTAKLNSLGDSQWVRKYNGTANVSIDLANDLKTDANGNVFVVGSTKNSGSSNDFTTIKYTSIGDSSWIVKYNNALLNGSEKANAIDFDANGNCYVTGYGETQNGTISDDFLTIKYNPNGVQQWALKYNGTGNGEDRANFVKVGSAHVFVGGKSWNGSNFDFAIQVYTLAGSLAGIGIFDGIVGDDIPTGMEIDAAENVYFTGKSETAAGDWDFATVKFNASGTLVWTKKFNGSLNSNDIPNGIALDNSSNVFVTGVTDKDILGTTHSADFATLAYTSNGDTLWAKKYNGASNLDDAAMAIALDAYGNCFVTGEVENGSASVSNLDIVTLKYSPSGSLLVSATYNGTGNAKDSPNSISIHNDNVYVCGESNGGAASQKDLLVLKYDDFVLGNKSIIKAENGVKIHPNPANTYFEFNLTNEELGNFHANFLLYNETGELISNKEILKSGRQVFEKNNLPSGLYFYKIIQDGRVKDAGKISFQ